jgi:hypothetical protein
VSTCMPRSGDVHRALECHRIGCGGSCEGAVKGLCRGCEVSVTASAVKGLPEIAIPSHEIEISSWPETSGL